MATYMHAKSAGTPTWVDLVSPDPEASRNFYHALFGWEYDIGGPEFGGYATAKKGTLNTAGIGGQPPGMPANVPAVWQLYFASGDLKADVARAQQLGAKELYPVMEVGAFGGMASLADPTGAEFNYWKAGTHVGFQVTDEPGSVTWHELYSPDAKKARDFYTSLLGVTADPMPGGMEYYVLKRGNDMLAGIMPIDPSWGNLRPFWATYFAVANTDEAAAIIQKHGGKIQGNIGDTPFGRMASAVDPHGAQFRILQLPAR